MGDIPAAQRFGEDGQVGVADQLDRGGHLLGGGAGPVGVAVQHGGGVVGGEVEAAAVEAGDREEVDLHGDDHAEVVLAAAQGPEQVGFPVRGGGAQFAVGGDHVEAADVVGGEAVAAAEQADAAAEGVADGADVRVGAAQRGEAVRDGRGDDLVPADSGGEPGGAGLGVDGDALHPAGGDHQVAVGGDGDAVAGGLDGDAEAGRGRVPDGGLHVGGAGGTDHQRGVVVERQVVARPLGVVAVVARPEHRPRYPDHAPTLTPGRPGRRCAAASVSGRGAPPRPAVVGSEDGPQGH